MKDKNVCKFIPDAAPSDLQTVHFIFESNAQQQAKGAPLEHHRMYLVAHGQGTFRFGREEVSAVRGDMLFGFPGEELVATGTELEYFSIGFFGHRTGELFRRFGVTPTTRKFSGHENLLPFWRENIARATDENIDIISESVLMYAFSKLTGIRESTPDVARLMAAYAEEHFSDGDLSLQYLADAWGYNPKYLSDSFKKRMGVGFSQYLKNLRIKHAILLMEHGVESVKNISFLCGFRDPLYFSKVFRADMGLSPKEYLQRDKQSDGQRKEI